MFGINASPNRDIESNYWALKQPSDETRTPLKVNSSVQRRATKGQATFDLVVQKTQHATDDDFSLVSKRNGATGIQASG